jgi:hypothetical protein
LLLLRSSEGWQDSHLHWRRSRRRVSSCWTTRAIGARRWILQPVLPRPDFFTKEIRRLLHGGSSNHFRFLIGRKRHALRCVDHKSKIKNKSSGAGLPSRSSKVEIADRTPAFATLRRGSLALAALRAKAGALTRNCTGLTPIPKECIATNALRASYLRFWIYDLRKWKW